MVLEEGLFQLIGSAIGSLLCFDELMIVLLLQLINLLEPLYDIGLFGDVAVILVREMVVVVVLLLAFDLFYFVG